MRKGLPTLFLDRDGTLIREADYLRDPKKVKLLPGVPGALRRLQKAGYSLVVVSNQSGVARGLITPVELAAVRARFSALLAQERIVLAGYYVCPHAPDKGCACRKPRPGMLRRAGRKLNRPWRYGVSIGDKPSDVRLSQAAGGWGILTLSGYGRQNLKKWTGRKPDYVARNLAAAAQWILTHTRKDGTWTLL